MSELTKSEDVIEKDHFTVQSVAAENAVVQFPVKIIDITTPQTVDAPHEHIGMGQQTGADEIMVTMNKTGIRNVIQFSQEETPQWLAIASRIIQNPKAFLENPSAQILDANRGRSKEALQVVERRWSFESSGQKAYILNMVSKFLSNVGGAKPLAESINFITDELFTNALYNAPFADVDYTLDRSTSVLLDPALSSELIIAHNTKHLLLGCMDKFGTFDCENFISQCARNFSLNIDKVINMGIGGAGIGMIRMIDLAPNIFIVVQKNKLTFVGCCFPLKTNSRKIRGSPKNFLFNSFEDFKSASTSLRIERRGKKVYIHCMGSLDVHSPFNDLDLIGTTELSFNMRLLRDITDDSLEKFFNSLTTIPTLKKVFIDYLPQGLFESVAAIARNHSGRVEIRSLCSTATCKTCKVTHHVTLKRAAAVPTANAEVPLLCSLCHETIVLGK